MNRAKFSFNAFLLIVILAAAVLFFVSITLAGLSDRSAVNQYFPIEGSGLGVRYSDKKANGIYIGEEDYSNALALEGDFGHDWGACAIGSSLYINEYRTSDLNLFFCDLDLVDTGSFSKQTLFKNTILRGQCASGELVCVKDYIPMASSPETNPLCGLYRFSSQALSDGPEIIFINPENAEVVGSLPFDGSEDGFEEKYLSRTMEEIMK